MCLSRCLVDNEFKDPASLVQLAKCLEERLQGLGKQVAFVAADGNNNCCDKSEMEIDDEVELGEVSGWRQSASSRVIFLPFRSSDELTELVSSVCWISDQDTDDLILSGQHEVCFVFIHL